MKYREFWIDDEGMALNSVPLHSEYIHVIDYAAYTDALKMLEEMAGALSEAQGHFLSIKLGYAFEVGNTPKAISENATQSISDTLDKYRKWKEGIK